MIRRPLDLKLCLIERSISGYDQSTNPFYNASYDLIKNKNIWKEFNKNWTEKLALVFSWIPRIAGRDLCKDFKLEIRQGESFETCIQRRCEQEVMDNGFNLTRGDCLVNWDEGNKEKSLIRAYDFLLKVAGQVGASKILHFSFPSLCLMWDNDQIKWLYKVDNIKYHKKVSGSHYVEYHKWAKRMIDGSEDRDSIIRKHAKEFPRILDICVWAKAKRKGKQKKR